MITTVLLVYVHIYDETFFLTFGLQRIENQEQHRCNPPVLESLAFYSPSRAGAQISEKKVI